MRSLPAARVVMAAAAAGIVLPVAAQVPDDVTWSGLRVARPYASISLGVDSDVVLKRVGAGQLQMECDLTVDGAVNVGGGLSFVANDGATTVSLADLYDLLLANSAAIAANAAEVSDQLQLLSESIATNTAAIETLEDEVALLFNEVGVDKGVYESDFHTGSTGDWVVSGANLQTLSCDGFEMLGGNLDSSDSVSLYVGDIPAHSSLEVTFVYGAIDSAGTQTPSCFVDGAQVWTDTFSSSLIVFENLCSSANGDQLEQVTVTVDDHFTQGATLKLTSTVTSGTWAVADVSVTSALSSDYDVVYASDFTGNDAVGWTPLGDSDAPATTACNNDGDQLLILGGPDVVIAEPSLVKKLTDLPDHTELIVAFEFLQFDDWAGESAELFVDNKLVWSQSLTTISSSDSSNHCADSELAEQLLPVTVAFTHHEASAELRFSSTTNVVTTQQVWGIKSLNVVAHTPAVNVVYESNFEDADGWTFSGATASVTSCGATKVLGGYVVVVVVVVAAATTVAHSAALWAAKELAVTPAKSVHVLVVLLFRTHVPGGTWSVCM
jgi:hypothetical protein